MSIFLGWKTRENVVVWDFLAVDNFDFTRKIVKKIMGEKLATMLGFCQNWIFWTKNEDFEQCDFVALLTSTPSFCFNSSHFSTPVACSRGSFISEVKSKCFSNWISQNLRKPSKLLTIFLPEASTRCESTGRNYLGITKNWSETNVSHGRHFPL